MRADNTVPLNYVHMVTLVGGVYSDLMPPTVYIFKLSPIISEPRKIGTATNRHHCNDVSVKREWLKHAGPGAGNLHLNPIFSNDRLF
jgi:hypothetical protein